MTMKALRRRLSYANVMATIAVFVALGGGAYAMSLPKNSVGPQQLKKNAVTTTKVKNGAITGQKINLSTLGTVPSAATAGSAGTAGKASDADTLGGEPASAFAASTVVRSATVNGSGGFVTAKSDGIGLNNFVQKGTGFYCIKGLNPAPRTAVASVDLTAEQGSTVATGVEAEPDCQVTIFTYDKAGNDANRPFSVIVH
jgi:hypothetical protein